MAHYVCPLCGKRGVPDEAYTKLDDRYTLGRCPDHSSITTLVREDFAFTEKKKRKKR